jgi:hypothetical protein
VRASQAFHINCANCEANGRDFSEAEMRALKERKVPMGFGALGGSLVINDNINTYF